MALHHRIVPRHLVAQLRFSQAGAEKEAENNIAYMQTIMTYDAHIDNASQSIGVPESCDKHYGA